MLNSPKLKTQLVRISLCYNLSGRVYFLKFESYEDKYFFWFQVKIVRLFIQKEKDTTKDDDICKRVNDLIEFDEDAIVEEKKVDAPQPTQTKPTTTQPQPKTTGQSPADLAQFLSQAMANYNPGERKKPSKLFLKKLT